MPETRYRSIELERAASGEPVPAVLASETPVERWGWREVFDLSSASNVDTSRQPLPLLVGHDSSTIPVGTVRNVRVAGRRIRGEVHFSNSPRGQELRQAAEEGTLRSLSVGYIVHEADEPVPGEVHVRRLELLEVSAVAVPADPQAGLYRSHPTMPESTNPTRAERREQHQAREAQQHAQREAEVAEMRTLGERFRHIAGAEDAIEDLIATGGTLGDVQAALRSRLINLQPVPVPAARNFDHEGVHMTRGGHISGGVPASIQPVQRNAAGYQAFGPDDETRSRNAYAAGMWARAALLGDEEAARWCRGAHGFSRALAGGIANKGGVLVPDEMASAIISLREEYGVARAFCRVWPMSSDTLWIPRRAGGVTAYFTGENNEITESDQDWDGVQLVARKLAALTRVSSELLEDAVIDMASHLADEFAYSFAEKEDDCLFNGDGTSTYGGITGLANKLNATSLAGVIEATTGTDTFAEVDVEDLANVMAALPLYAHRRAAWYCSQAAYSLVFQRIMQNAGGATMMETGALQLGRYSGYPIRISQKLPTTSGTINGSVMVYFGDLSMAAAMGDRRGFRAQVLEERYAEYDQLGIRGTERFDIVVHDVGDTSTAGPIVALWGKTS